MPEGPYAKVTDFKTIPGTKKCPSIFTEFYYEFELPNTPKVSPCHYDHVFLMSQHPKCTQFLQSTAGWESMLQRQTSMFHLHTSTKYFSLPSSLSVSTVFLRGYLDARMTK